MKNIYFSIILFLISNVSHSLNIDEKLDLVKKVYNLKPKNCEPIKRNVHKLNAGKELFNTLSLSGGRDISCAKCHIDRFGTADGLPIAVGVGGKGEGLDRYHSSKGVLVQRNAFSLKGRASKEFTAFFWDGKAQKIGNNFITQFGDHVNERFDSILAAASILPLIERDEFLGEGKNKFRKHTWDTYYYDRYVTLSKLIRERVISPKNEDDKKLKEILEKAKINLSKFDLAEIGNLIALHIENKFKCDESKWDKYLEGQKDVISLSEKRGAILFYGKGRCASCHSGSFQSDMDYHSIGTPQGFFGPHSRHRDIGRSGVTNLEKDLYKFRTPPLNGVSKTPPYGHNGAFKNLKEVVIHHFNPIDFYRSNDDYYKADYFNIGKLLNSRDPLLKSLDLNKEEELEYLVKFLESL